MVVLEKEINANRNADGGYSTEEINSEYIHWQEYIMCDF